MENAGTSSALPSEGVNRKPCSGTPGCDHDAGLSGPGVFDDAAASRTVWCKVHGFPWWPAQVFDKDAAHTFLGNVPHRCSTDVPVIFFGTSEIAWMAERDVASWEAGIGQNFHSKGRKNKKFMLAIEQVRSFLSITKPRHAPDGWWCAPPARSGDPAQITAFSDAFEAQQEALRRPSTKHKQGAQAAAAAAGEAAGDEALHMAAAAIAGLACGGHMAWGSADDVKAELQQRKKGSAQRRQKQQGQQQQQGQEDREMPDAAKGEADELKRTKRPRERRVASADGGVDTQMQLDVSGGSGSDAAEAGADGGAAGQLLDGCGPSTKRRKLLPKSEATAAGAAGTVEDGSAQEAEAGHSGVCLEPPAPLPVLPSDWLEQGPVLPESPVAFELSRGYLLNRPPQYEHVRRNTWVSRGRPKRLNKDEVAVCNCRVEVIPGKDGAPDVRIGCGEGCLNRLSYIHCDPRTCPCGTECSNRPFHLVKMPKMEVFLTDNRGHGVRATANMQRGSFVVEYAGEVIDEAELQRRMDACGASGEQHFYIMELQSGLFIDARKRGNLARLLNSSCDPNCETQKWFDAATGEMRIGIFARRDIAPGEELTYDYMFEHYGLSNVAQGFRCQCGAKNCRGTMDINPERRRDLGRRVEVFWEGDGVFYRGTIIAYSTTTRKHTVLYDDGDQERVCLDAVPHRWLEEHASPRPSAQAPSPAPSGNLRRYGPHPSPRPAQDSDSDGSWSQAKGANGSAEADTAAQAAAAAAAAEAEEVKLQSPPKLFGRGRRVSGAVSRPVVAEVWEDDANAASALITLGLAAMEVEGGAGQGSKAAPIAEIAAAAAAAAVAAAEGGEAARAEGLGAASISGTHGATSELREGKKRRLSLTAVAGNKAALAEAGAAAAAAGIAAAHTSSTSSQSACQLDPGSGSQPTSPHSRASSAAAAAAVAATAAGISSAAGISATPGRSGGRARKQQQPSPAASRGRGGEAVEDAATHKSSGSGERAEGPVATGCAAQAAGPGTVAVAAHAAAVGAAAAAASASAAAAAASPMLGVLSSSLPGDMVPMQQLMQGISQVKSQGPALFQGSASSSKGSLGSTATTATTPLPVAAALANTQSQQSVGQQQGMNGAQQARAAPAVNARFGNLLQLVAAVQPEIEEHYSRSGQLAAAAAAAAATAANGVYDPHAAAVAAAATAGKAWSADPPLFCLPGAQNQAMQGRPGASAPELALAALLQQQQVAGSAQAVALLALQQQHQQQQLLAAAQLQQQLSLGIAAAALAPVVGWQGQQQGPGINLGLGGDAMHHLNIGMLPINVANAQAAHAVQPGAAAQAGSQPAVPADAAAAAPSAHHTHQQVAMQATPPSAPQTQQQAAVMQLGSAFGPVIAATVAGAVPSPVQHAPHGPQQQQQMEQQAAQQLQQSQQLQQLQQLALKELQQQRAHLELQQLLELQVTERLSPHVLN